MGGAEVCLLVWKESVYAEFVVWCDVDKLTEVGGEAHEGAATQCLDNPNHARDLSSAPVHSFETVFVTRATLHLFFSLVRLDHGLHCAIQGFVKIIVRHGSWLCAQPTHRLHRIHKAILSYEPPRGLRREVNGEEDWDWKDPLKCERDAIGPRGFVVYHAAHDNGCY